MRVVEQFPHPVRVIENLWIPLSDGCRLAARVWLPANAEQQPVPAILEYIPYRKRDFTRNRDEPMHYYFAGHGYAAVRVDLRGSGDSDGVLLDEYLPQEQIDAVEIIAWLSQQPWCNGKVGMMGISWGGFNAMQVAAQQPEPLKAIITLCSTDDRYADDAHYMGGCLLSENLLWGAIFFTINALPPDPLIVGDRWQAMWQERLENAVPFPALWMQHPQRDAYWQQGSVCEDYQRIQCPVFAVGGWADGYSNAILRLLSGLQVPRKGLIGPWGHAFPHNATPGPAIGFLQEALRWWDYWLQDRDTGIMAEPMLRAWIQDSVSSAPSHNERPGHWVAESVWPSPRLQTRSYYFSAAMGLLSRADAVDMVLQKCSPQTTGLASGDWCGFGADGSLPGDQREDDGKSLCFDSDVLDFELTVLGAPVVELEFSVDQPQAIVALRLNDVAPDGASLRVSYTVFNLTHLNGHQQAEPLRPGQRYRVRIPLNDCGHCFPVGHSIRIALSTSYWPLAWPAPVPVTLSIYPTHCRLFLPERPDRNDSDAVIFFAAPESGPAVEHTTLRMAHTERSINHDLLTNETVYTVISDGGDYAGAALAYVHDIDLDVGHTVNICYAITADDPLTARAEIQQKTQLRRPGWNIQVETRMRLSATRDRFLLATDLQAFEGENSICDRHWEQSVARKLV